MESSSKMKKVNRNASASIFGWQFQINAAILLMIKYFGKFEKLKVEGKNEDIEIILKDNKKIYAQAKSKQIIDYNNKRDYISKLKKALNSLSDVKDDNTESLIYINNLEPHPLNVNSREFELVSFLSYKELSTNSKLIIDNQLKLLKKEIDREKLIIAKVPFYGNDISTRHRFINAEIEKFLAVISSDLIPYSKRLLEMWESEFLQNATESNINININKTDVLWKLIVFKIENNSSDKYEEKMQIDEEDYYDALDKYEKIINYKEASFETYNKISHLIVKEIMINPNINSIEFVVKYSNDIYNSVFGDNKNRNEEVIEKACAKIIARKIFIRKKSLIDLIERTQKYEN